MAQEKEQLKVVFRVEFWDYYKHRWKSYEVDCPIQRTIEEYAECIANELAEWYAERLYRECVKTTGENIACSQIKTVWKATYRDRMKPIIEEFLESKSARKVIRLSAQKIAKLSEDVLAMLQSRNIAVAKYIDCLKKNRKCVVGLSSTNLVMFDSDCRKFQCLRDIILLALLLCRTFKISSIVYPTRRGFHLLGLTPVDKKTWKKIYLAVDALAEEGKLPNIDRLHIHMSLARGYATLSVSAYRDIHYWINATLTPSGELAGCILYYSPTAMYLRRVLAELSMEFDLVDVITKDPYYRQLREKWVEFLKAVGEI